MVCVCLPELSALFGGAGRDADVQGLLSLSTLTMPKFCVLYAALRVGTLPGPCTCAAAASRPALLCVCLG